jgi:sulfoxide reductase heme-binding subunit YedZ
MNIRKFFHITIIPFLLFFSDISYVSGKNHDFPGAKNIFYTIGLEIPEKWQEWSRTDRHTYLKNLGLEPSQGGHYKGHITDLSGYFSVLGIQQPENWEKMTFEEKNTLVKQSDFFYFSTPKKIQKTSYSPSPDTKISQKFLPTKVVAIWEKYIPIFLFTGSSLILFIGVLWSISPHKTYRKILQIMVYYILPAVLFFFSIWVPKRSLFLAMGNISEWFLLFILFIKPVAVIFRYSFLMRFLSLRREFGILTFWFFLFHASGFIALYDLFHFSEYMTRPPLFFGSIAGIGMLLLGLTSNNFSVKLLKRHWKKLQYVAYPVLLFTLLHSSLASDDGYTKILIIIFLFMVLKAGEWKKHKEKRRQH